MAVALLLAAGGERMTATMTLMDRARAASVAGSDRREQEWQSVREQLAIRTRRLFETGCVNAFDVTPDEIGRITVTVSDDGEQFCASALVAGSECEVTYQRDTLAQLVYRDTMGGAAVLLPCIECQEEWAFYVDSLAALGDVLADQRCPLCGGRTHAEVPASRRPIAIEVLR